MEQIFWVKNGNLREVNEWLQRGGRVKSIHVVPEPIVAYGYAGGARDYDTHGSYVADIYAYVIVEFD